MAVTDEFFQSRREGPVNAVSGMLRNWFAERKRMNDEAYAAEAGGDEDPAELAKAELRAREGAAEMQRTLTEAIRQGKNDESELLRELARGNAAIRVANVDAEKAKAVARLGLVQRLYDQATTENANLEKSAQFKDETINQLETAAQTATTPESAAAQFAALAREAQAGGPGDARYDALAAEFERKLIAANRPDVAAVGKLVNGQKEGMSAVEWYAYRHSRATYDEMSKRADEEARRAGGGYSDPAGVARDMERMGVDTKSLATQTGGGETTRTRDETGDRGGGSTPDDDTVSLAFRGDPQAIAAYAKARKEGADPYEAIQAGIASMNAFADDLAARREEASRSRRKPFPRANPYVANPNRYVPAEGVRATGIIAQDDPGRSRERASAILRGERADNIEAEFAPGQFDAPQFEREGDDLLNWLSNNIGPTEFTDTDGKYKYRLNADGSVTILASPVKGAKVPTDVAADSDAAKAIRKQATDRGIRSVFDVIAAQPPEVQALLEPAAIRAQSGDISGARKAINRLDPDDVRYAYASAFRQASGDPTKVTGLHTALSALPEDVMTETRGALGRTLDRYQAGRARGGEWASSRARGEFDSIGRALVGASASGAKRDARATGEERDRDEEADTRAGAALVDLAMGQGRSADDIRRGWELAPDSAIKRAALARLGPFGPGPDKAARETAEKGRTGRMPSVETAVDEVQRVDRPVVKAPDTAAVLASEEKAPKPAISDEDAALLDDFDSMIEPGNIDLTTRPIVHNKDGSYSTVYSYTVPFDEGSADESWFNIPGVAEDGSRQLTEQEAVEQFKRSKKHLGRYADKDSAVKAAESLHEDQAQEYDAVATPPLTKEDADLLDSL